jgi:hypothetical protein
MTISVCVIAYLRELFPEKAFVSDQSTGLELKRLLRGKSSKIDKLLDLLEKGCFDAMQRKFLKTLILSIYTDKKNPSAVIECFKFHIAYGNSDSLPMPKSMKKNPDVTAVSILRNESNLINFSSSNDFKKTSIVLLKELCSLVSSLPSLPSNSSINQIEKKYIQLGINYYEVFIPSDYCPPGFKNFPINDKQIWLFNGPSVNHMFGQAKNDHLRCSLELERRQDKNYELEDLTLEHSQPLIIGKPSQTTINIQQIDDQSTQMISPTKTQEKITCNTNDFTIETPRLIQPKILPKLDIDKIIGTFKTGTKSAVANETMNVKCYCDDSRLSDLDMIQCESCSLWQHTVCAGFFGNNDPRIQSFRYICFGCQYRDENPQRSNTLFTFLKDLTNFRRVLSVTFNEQVSNHTWLGKRLSLHFRKAKKYFDRMKAEGFIIKVDPEQSQDLQGIAYQTVRTRHIREQIRKYFNPNVENYPEIQRLRADKGGLNDKVGCKKTAAEIMALGSVFSCLSEI